MKMDPKTLPDDVMQLKQNIVDLAAELHNSKIAYMALEEKFKAVLYQRYGRSSEKQADDKSQPELFNESELEAQESADQTLEENKETITYTRKKTGRKPIPKDLPCERVEHDLPDEEKFCKCCSKERPRVSEKTTKEVDYVPARIIAVEHVYPVYGPCSCESFSDSEQPEMLQPKAIPRLLPGSMAGPGLLAHMITAKYADSLPFYRQEKIFKRLGFDLSRETMCNWFLSAARKCQDIIDLLWEDIMTSPLMQMDETSVQVLKENGREASRKSYMWVNIGYPNGKPIALFHYHPGRSRDIPLEILKNYKGHLQTDGYAGYNAAGSLPGIEHVGCWAHARRKFFEASKISKKSSSAQVALSHIRKLYAIEKKLRNENLSNDDFVRKRQEQTIPVLKKFHAWLKKKENEIPPKTLMGTAVSYTLNEWDKLIRYLDGWYLTPDNNRAENAIRPFVIGRKNWLFSDTSRGAHASAAFYSLVITAELNGLEPYYYLRYLFIMLPKAKTLEEKRALLPHRVSVVDIVKVLEI